MIEYLDMKYKKSLVLICSLTFVLLGGGCTGGGGMWMGSSQPPAAIQSSVMLLNEPPNWPYRVVGYVQSQGTSLSKDVDVFRGIQAEAAKIGAPAVIVDHDFIDFTATPGPDSLLGMPLKGTAIAPVSLSPSEMEKWKASRVPASMSRKRPSVQTIGQ